MVVQFGPDDTFVDIPVTGINLGWYGSQICHSPILNFLLKKKRKHNHASYRKRKFSVLKIIKLFAVVILNKISIVILILSIHVI